MKKISDPWDHHDWSSQSYVSRWAERQDGREADREDIFRLITKILPYDQAAKIKILDVGAGYGALTQFLLDLYPNAAAVCQDGSEEMAKLGRVRMKHLKGRVKYVLCDFSKPGWSRKINGPFDAVVSSIAIHNVRSPAVIRAIYGEIFGLIKTGGCFVNFDRMTPSLTDQMQWLKESGFKKVKRCGEDGRRAVLVGFKITSVG